MSEPRMIPADEAKQLREGITPGRWRLNEWESVVGLTIEYWNESTMEVANVKLAEAAPDLAHTVVEQAAQIERVREALKALRDYYIDREARSRERLESATDEREQFQFARFAHMHRRAHEALTRILDGSNDD